MIVTVFRSRLRPELGDEYAALADRMSELARTMPGYVSEKNFVAEDGERVTIVEFENEEGLRAWRTNPGTSSRRKGWGGRSITPSTTFRSARSIAN